MTEQNLPRAVANAPGGEEKTSVETDLAALLADEPQSNWVRIVDLDPQPNAEGLAAPYRPIIFDLPSTQR
ncbi:hypothetical protein [Streptomyces sp. NPDC018059]|uniref:hypothetical protein n=1 Tax=Streptomyces sp. NPDC018059 TaxID=3365041 RepID=UPI0037A15853